MHLLNRVDKDGLQEEGPYAGRKNPEFTRRSRTRRYRPPPPPEDYEQLVEEEKPKKKKKRKGPIYCPEGKPQKNVLIFLYNAGFCDIEHAQKQKQTNQFIL